jgi:replicative DNA helicase
MINEYFLNKSLKVLSSVKNDYIHTRELFSSIYQIINWYINQIPEEYIPYQLKDKLELVKFLSKYRYKNRNNNFVLEELLDNLKNSKFKELTTLLEHLYEQDLSTDYIDEQLSFFLQKKKMTDLMKDRKEFETILNNVESVNYDSPDQILEDWEKLITESYNSLITIKRIETVSNASSLDLLNDEYSGVLNKFINSYKEAKIIKTGYEDIDGQLPFGGLEKRRLYIFGGETGVGKSTILANIITNAVENNVSSEIETYLYITAENLIDESLIRFYCCMTGESVANTINKIVTTPNFDKIMKNTLVTELKKHNSNIIFFYVEPRKTTLPEVESIVDEVSRNHNLKAVFIDYLDLIRSGTNQSELRHELGEVTLGFKQIAISYDVALITATQLNRSGYNGQVASLTSMKESMRKAEDSDFVGFLQNPKDSNIIKYRNSDGLEIEAQVIKFTILKSRNGAVGHSADFIMIKKVEGFPEFNYKIIPKPQIKEQDMVSTTFDIDGI